jgi:hypothetical protein
VSFFFGLLSTGGKDCTVSRMVMLLLKVVTDVLYCCLIMGSMFLLFGLLFLVHMEIS